MRPQHPTVKIRTFKMAPFQQMARRLPQTRNRHFLPLYSILLRFLPWQLWGQKDSSVHLFVSSSHSVCHCQFITISSSLLVRLSESSSLSLHHSISSSFCQFATVSSSLIQCTRHWSINLVFLPIVFVACHATYKTLSLSVGQSVHLHKLFIALTRECHVLLH